MARMRIDGYQPNKSDLNDSNPPKGGSGIPIGKIHVVGNWFEVTEGSVLNAFFRFTEKIARIGGLILLGSMLGYIWAWWVYVGRLSGGE